MYTWMDSESTIFVNYVETPKYAKHQLRPVLGMVDKGEATRMSVIAFLGVPSLAREVTIPLGNALKDLQASGGLNPLLPFPLKPYPSLQRHKYPSGDYPFEFSDEAKDAFHAALTKATVAAAIAPGPPPPPKTVPRLPGWLTAPEAAKVLGVTKQGIHQLIHSDKKPLPSTHRIGDGKPVYLLWELEVLELQAHRAAKKGA